MNKKRRAGWGKRSGLTYKQSPKWKQIRLAVLKRDGFRCTALDGNTNERCCEKATDVDHVEGHSDALENLTSLCSHHHHMKTSSETYEKNKARRDAAMLRAGDAVRGLGGRIVPVGEGPVGAGVNWKKWRALADQVGKGNRALEVIKKVTGPDEKKEDK